MNREEYFHNDISRIEFNRTRFDMPFQHQTAFNVGDIVPLMAEPIYPGDSVSSKVAYLVRAFTPINQIFSNLYLDIYAFFVPYRLVWTHWANFLGENDEHAWTSSSSYTIPFNTFSIDASLNEDFGTDEYFKSFGGYLGINFTQREQSGGHVVSYDVEISDLFRRSYLAIYNEWWRDEQVIDPILYSVDDDPEELPVFTYQSPLLKAAKFHDYFTSVSPQAQFGEPVVLGNDLPVIPKNQYSDTLLNGVPMRMSKVDGSPLELGTNYDLYAGSSSPAVRLPVKGKSGFTSGSGDPWMAPVNLWAKMTITIEDLRKSIALQHLTEKLAQSGSRYPEFLKGIWSVTSSDARLQIPEYLGGKRFPIHVSEVVSTADTVSSSNGQPLGSTGAMIKDGNVGELFNKAFTEYGQLWILGCVRVEQTYFQGLARKFTDLEFGDFYNPYVANLGNQPRYTRELYALGSGSAVFGFGGAWDHLRYTPYLATSIMRPDLNAGLQSWSAAEVYSSAPTLNQTFIEQPATGFDRTLAVPSTARNAFQFFGEFKFMNTWTRVLPAYPSPGLARI